MKTPEYLELVKRKLSLPSDYALAKALGVSRSAISLLQAGKTAMSDETAVRAAEILAMPAGRVLIDVHMERSKAPEVRAAWMGMMEKFSASFNALISCADPRRTPRPA